MYVYVGLSSSDPDKALKKELLDRLEIPVYVPNMYVTGRYSLSMPLRLFSDEVRFYVSFTRTSIQCILLNQLSLYFSCGEIWGTCMQE